MESSAAKWTIVTLKARLCYASQHDRSLRITPPGTVSGSLVKVLEAVAVNGEILLNITRQFRRILTWENQFHLAIKIYALCSQSHNIQISSYD